jgi:outer membrane protein TolC
MVAQPIFNLGQVRLNVRSKRSSSCSRMSPRTPRVSGERQQAGTTNYLEVLTNDTNYLTAELGLAQARLNELLALVQIYKALGGGWQR